MTDLARARRFYADLVTAGCTDPRIATIFVSLKRERFAGPGPWQIRAGGRYVATPDDDPVWLYQDVLVALDAARGINIGEPSLHALCLDAVAVQPGETVLHIGAGSGHYTAMLARLAAPGGAVAAYEIDPDLAARARANLADTPGVAVQAVSGSAGTLPPADVIYVNASAPAPAAAWLDALRPAGRLIFPLTPEGEFGGMLLATRRDARRFDARFVHRVAFIPCQGVQDPAQGRALAAVFAQGGFWNVRALRLDAPDDTCWFAGDGWWLSTRGFD
jgi:protein-L-isoaspartate(D-aspartate) O-methyltransferase